MKKSKEFMTDESGWLTWQRVFWIDIIAAAVVTANRILTYMCSDTTPLKMRHRTPLPSCKLGSVSSPKEIST